MLSPGANATSQRKASSSIEAGALLQCRDRTPDSVSSTLPTTVIRGCTELPAAGVITWTAGGVLSTLTRTEVADRFPAAVDRFACHDLIRAFLGHGERLGATKHTTPRCRSTRRSLWYPFDSNRPHWGGGGLTIEIIVGGTRSIPSAVSEIRTSSGGKFPSREEKAKRPPTFCRCLGNGTGPGRSSSARRIQP